MSRMFSLALLSLLVFNFFSPPAHAAVTLLDQNDWNVMFSGFVETDLFYDTTRSFTEVVGSNPVSRGGTLAGDNGRTQFSLRNSRFGFGVVAPAEGEWKTRGYLEFDLLGYDPAPAVGGSSESGYQTNPTLRLRHGYLSAERSGFQVLVGQTWTLFGWAPAYTLTTASVPPVAGTLYERTPQVMLMKTCAAGEGNTFQTALAVNRPVQRDSDLPGLDLGARLQVGSRKAGYVSPSGDRKNEAMSFAVSGTARDFKSLSASGGTTALEDHIASAVALDTMIPIIAASDDKEVGNTLALSGEFTKGSGYSDELSFSGGLPQQVAGATTGIDLDPGQGGFDSTGAFNLVNLQSFSGQLQYHLPASMRSYIDLSYAQVKSSNIANLSASGTAATYNKAEVYTVNIFHDVTAHVRVALEADHFVTAFVDGSSAKDNRFQASTWFRF